MEFFAVTKTSLYRVTDEIDRESGFPIVEKIAIKKGMISAVPVGAKLKNGQLVGVLDVGIVLYDEDHPRLGSRQPPNTVNRIFWGGNTTAIKALFLDKQDALECLNSKDEEKVPYWKEKTKEAHDAIGRDHQVFIFATTFLP